MADLMILRPERGLLAAFVMVVEAADVWDGASPCGAPLGRAFGFCHHLAVTPALRGRFVNSAG